MLSNYVFSYNITNGLRQFLRLLCGVAVFCLAFALLLSFITYVSSDPSFFVSQEVGVIQNFVGIAGAYASDLFLRFFGAASYLVGAYLFVVSLRIINQAPKRNAWIVGLLFVASLVSCTAMIAVFLGADMPITHYPWGGVVSVVFYKHVLIEAYDVAPIWLWGSGFVVFAAASCLMLFGVSFERLVYAVRWTGHAAWYGAVWCGQSVYYWLVSLFDNKRADSVKQATVKSQPRCRVSKPKKEEMSGPYAEEDEISATPIQMTKGAKPIKQMALDLKKDSDFTLPPLDILGFDQAHSTERTPQELQELAKRLESILKDFGVRGDIVNIRPGPVVTLFELSPAPGTKSARVIGLSDDIARSMSAVSVRVAVVPGKDVIGIEMPNDNRETVYLKEMLASSVFQSSSHALPLVLGKDIGGAPIIADLAKMPHLLIAGTTGSGKSVGINTMILSLLYRFSPKECRLIMVDPKMLELSVYNDIPHLLTPVVTDPSKAVVALKWVVREMENRYRSMSMLNVRNITGFNKKIEEANKKGEVLSRKVQTGFEPETGAPIYEEQPLGNDPLPYLVVIIDELADLMLVAGKDVESLIQRLAQMARAAGIHLLMATQRPSVDVITGTVKANFPTRISFQVTSKIDSRTILGEGGAERLLGRGDMLYMAGGGRITRVHGPFVDDKEVEDIVAFLKSQGTPEYHDGVTIEPKGEEGGMGAGSGDAGASSTGDQLYDQALDIVQRERKASTSFIQRRLKIGYNRAATLIEELEQNGVVSGANHVGKREVLIPELEG